MRVKTGVVVSTKMAKTVVIRVDTYRVHSKYHKRFKVSKKFYAHVEDNSGYEEGQEISITESRPMSKLKRWVVILDSSENTAA